MKAQAKPVSRKAINNRIESVNTILLSVCCKFTCDINNMKRELLGMNGAQRFSAYGMFVERQIKRLTEERETYRNTRAALWSLTYEDDAVLNHTQQIVG